VNNLKLLKVNIIPTTTISQLKQTIKGVMVSRKYNKDDYTVRLIFNNGVELSPLIFNTNTYDNANFKSYEGKIQGGQIYINTTVEVVKEIKKLKLFVIPKPEDINQNDKSGFDHAWPEIMKRWKDVTRQRLWLAIMDQLVEGDVTMTINDPEKYEIAVELANEFEKNGFIISHSRYDPNTIEIDFPPK